jgi:hypothetical protein
MRFKPLIYKGFLVAKRDIYHLTRGHAFGILKPYIHLAYFIVPRKPKVCSKEKP